MLRWNHYRAAEHSHPTCSADLCDPCHSIPEAKTEQDRQVPLASAVAVPHLQGDFQVCIKFHFTHPFFYLDFFFFVK